ncbi:STAS/SEC14 domain-containing protein [Polyangium fumosum]|uniref:STAS/SEC14 domain-containing protein n=1 Tax=Polyangium fumosum TaxID=889272 RepID=A0A4U1JJN3_9BACT|nr:STAS/SEC14 domain-containing protein [Polyangium fumosum]TKD12780.1 STAS/SEC14 domain-containing protein [Polyangium fumosum]
MKEESSEDWTPLGAHRYRFEAPDLFVIRVVGDVSLSDTQAMFERIETFSGKAGRPIFWLSDISGLGQVTPDARKFPLALDATRWLRATVVFGGSFHQRLVANLVMKAIPLLRPSRQMRPLSFFPTEAEARAYVEAERRGGGSSS